MKYWLSLSCGLPVFPIFWVTLPNTHSILEITQSIGFLIAVTLLFSYLMVSKIPMLSLKLKGKKISNYIPQIILIVLFLSYLALSIVYVLPLTMLSYIALSVVFTKQN